MRFMMICFFAMTVVKAAWADQVLQAITYRGTIGTLPVIVELAGPDPDHFEAGRYAYMSKGGDIPLHRIKVGEGGSLIFQEEKPCTPEICKTAAGELVTTAPIGAEWVLKAAQNGGRLTGTWHDVGSKKMLPVNLKREGQRQFVQFGIERPLEPEEIVPVTIKEPSLYRMKQHFPYEFLKVDYPFQKGEPVKLRDMTYRMDIDPRVDIAYPVITKIGNIDLGPLNDYFLQQRLQFEFSPFRCLSTAYLGFNWYAVSSDGSDGYEGNYSIDIQHVSSRVISFREGGVFFCGGAHPTFDESYKMVEVKTGKSLEPEILLRNWIAQDENGHIVDQSKVWNSDDFIFKPDNTLIKYVRDHRRKFDKETEESCTFDDYIASHLSAHFTQDDLVFTLQALPHAIHICSTEDILTVPIKDARFLLTEKGAQYFEVLDR